MQEYHKKIIEYYRDTENAYRDCWDLDHSMSIHYGYRDAKARSFRQSLLRMNEVMIEAAGITAADKVLDAGCGVGGSGIFIARHTGANVTGITLSERQALKAGEYIRKNEVQSLVNVLEMDYCNTSFPDASFDVVWGCESICYAAGKDQFINEAARLLRPGGRLVVADGFVPDFACNQHPVIRQWLDGWRVNYLESPQRFTGFMEKAGFSGIRYRNISANVQHSSCRLYRLYFISSVLLKWRTMTSRRKPTDVQMANTRACKFQHKGLRKGLWQYGLIVGVKT